MKLQFVAHTVFIVLCVAFMLILVMPNTPDVWWFRAMVCVAVGFLTSHFAHKLFPLS